VSRDRNGPGGKAVYLSGAVRGAASVAHPASCGAGRRDALLDGTATTDSTVGGWGLHRQGDRPDAAHHVQDGRISQRTDDATVAASIHRRAGALRPHARPEQSLANSI